MELRNMMEGEGIKLKLWGLPGVLSPSTYVAFAL